MREEEREREHDYENESSYGVVSFSPLYWNIVHCVCIGYIKLHTITLNKVRDEDNIGESSSAYTHSSKVSTYTHILHKH